VSVAEDTPAHPRQPAPLPPIAGTRAAWPFDGILRDGRLAGHDPEALAERYGTPFYAYDLDGMAARVAALRAVLPRSFDLAFAVKANPSLAVLRHFARLGLGMDVASGGELRHVGRAGVEGGRVVFTGPGKRDEELAAAVEAGVRVVTVESPGELRRLARIAEAFGRRQPILLRANVAEARRHERVRIIGDEGAGKFGMSGADLRIAAAEAVASPWLEPLGLHAFGASNVLDAAVLVAHAAATVDAAASLAAEAGFPLRLVDAGGGLGIPYADDEPVLDLTALGSGLQALADRMTADAATRDTCVLLEPGRFLVGPCGAYVARVVDRKVVGGRPVVVVDGGIHGVLRPVLVRQEHRVVALRTRHDDAGPASGTVSHATPELVTVAGPLCSGLDVLAAGTSMVPPEPGDLVAVLDVGAYGATESMPHFLGHPLPAEVALRGSEAWAARPRLDPDSWLETQVGEPPAR
jgi:diaminopimelate decarboxylase